MDEMTLQARNDAMQRITLARLADENEELRNGIAFAASWIESGRSIDGLAARMREMLVPNAPSERGEPR